MMVGTPLSLAILVIRVATSFPQLTQRFFRDLGVRVELAPVSGAVEIAPHLGVADVIVDLTATGSTLRINGLKEIATVMESTARLVAASEAVRDPERGAEVTHLVTALESVGIRVDPANKTLKRLPAIPLK